MRFTTLIMFLFLCSFDHCFANVAAFEPAPAGNNLVPYTLEGVQLLIEEVHVYHDSTVCKYKLKNLRRETVEFTMGFPLDYGGLNKKVYPHLDRAYETCDFMTFIDSASQKVAYNVSKEEKYSYIYSWNVEMQPGEDKEIICKFKTIWSNTLSKRGGSMLSMRLLRSPANQWHDKIIEAHYYIHLDSIFNTSNPIHHRIANKSRSNYLEIKPKWYYHNLSDNRIEWHQNNVEKVTDISFKIIELDLYNKFNILDQIHDQYRFLFSHYSDFDFEMVEKLESEQNLEKVLSILDLSERFPDYGHEEWFKRLQIRVARNYYFARNGWTFEDPVLNRIFETVRKNTESKPFKKFSKVEKHNILFIKNYEEKYYRFED